MKIEIHSIPEEGGDTVMAGKTDAVARYDAEERYAYAAAVGDRDAMSDAWVQLTSESQAVHDPSPEVVAVLVENDPASAAAVGLLTFTDLVKRVGADPARYLDPAEVEAVRVGGPHVLRLVVACRRKGVSLESELEASPGSSNSQFTLAARGTLKDPEALARLLREHGLLTDADTE